MTTPNDGNSISKQINLVFSSFTHQRLFPTFFMYGNLCSSCSPCKNVQPLRNSLDPSERTANACTLKGRTVYFALKISEHLNPRTISKLYKKVVPSVFYGSELWCDLKQKDTQNRNTFQHFICKYTMMLSKQIRSNMCKSLLDFLPISS